MFNETELAMMLAAAALIGAALMNLLKDEKEFL